MGTLHRREEASVIVLTLARKPVVGTVAQNALRHGTGAINVDGCRVGTDAGWSYPNGRGGEGWHGRESLSRNLDTPMQATSGRWPANVILAHLPGCAETCAPGCPVPELNQQSGFSRSAPGVQEYVRAATSGWRERGGSFIPGRTWEAEGYADEGGASHFFRQVGGQR